MFWGAYHATDNKNWKMTVATTCNGSFERREAVEEQTAPIQQKVTKRQCFTHVFNSVCEIIFVFKAAKAGSIHASLTQSQNS